MLFYVQFFFDYCIFFVAIYFQMVHYFFVGNEVNTLSKL